MQKKNRIQQIWGLAKSPELQLEKEELYNVMFRLTGKDSMSSLSEKEKGRLIGELIDMKERAQGKKVSSNKRRYRDGRMTPEQYEKIKMLERDLGWSDNPKRLESFIKKYSKVDSSDWLMEYQASNIIEGLKAVLKRQLEKEQGDGHENKKETKVGAN